METQWHASGEVYIACNCDYGCPCNFNALPSHGYCHGQWTWAIEQGTFGDVVLDGIPFTLAVKWPGAIHEGGGHGLLLVDERASEEQREAIHLLVKGDFGGPWGILGWTWPTLDGPVAVPFEIEGEGVEYRVRAGECFELESEPIRNPVSGAEVHPSALLPEGLIVERGDFGSSRVFRIDEPIAIDLNGRYTARGAFEYSNAG